ncbi:MAG: MFS transporter [Mycobacterium sp.]
MKPSLYAVAASLYLTEYTLYSNSSSAVLLNSAIADYFGIPFAQASYIGVAFLAGFCLALLPAGFMLQPHSPIATFFAASAMVAALGVAASFSPEFWVLIAIRFLQGVASAVLAPQIFRIIRAQFYPGHHARVLGTWGLVVSASALCSPLITAVLNDTWGWRSFPYETVATTLTAMALMARAPGTTVERDRPIGRAPTPVIGLALLLTVIFLATGLAGTVSLKVALSVATVLLGIGVVAVCRQTARRTGQFQSILYPSFLVIFLAGIATNVFTLSVVYFVQQVRGLDSYRSALFLLPMAFFAGLIPMLKLGRPGTNGKNTRLVFLGTLWLVAAGLSIALPVLPATAALMGCAMGFLWSSLAANVIGNSTHIPFDSSVYHYLRALGAAIGVTVGATMIQVLGTGMFGAVAALVTVLGLLSATAAYSAWRTARLVTAG